MYKYLREELQLTRRSEVVWRCMDRLVSTLFGATQKELVLVRTSHPRERTK